MDAVASWSLAFMVAVTLRGRNFNNIDAVIISQYTLISLGLEGSLSSSNSAFFGNPLSFKKPQTSGTTAYGISFHEFPFSIHAHFWL
jgi:hypothetical protein